MTSTARLVVGVLAGALLTSGCDGASVAGNDDGLEPLVGEWRVVLLSQGGELPFTLRVDGAGTVPPAVVTNGGIESAVEQVSRQGAASYTLRFAAAEDAEIIVKMSPSGDQLSGFWRYRRDIENAAALGVDAVIQMPLSATRDDARRFQRNDPTIDIASPEGIAAVADLDGQWMIVEPAVVGLSPSAAASAGDDTGTIELFEQNGERVVWQSASRSPGVEMNGAVLEGIYRNGLLRLSFFDGFRARLVHARATPAGTLEGRLWAPGEIDGAVPWWAQRR